MDLLACSPILIPTLNRYEHFRNCIESLSKCTLADKTELVIGLDYPPSEKYVEGWNRIKEYIPSISGFGKITIFEEKEKNIGAVRNFQRIRKYVKDVGYDAYIFTDDDDVFSPNFLEYVNWGLKKFQKDKSILAVCGYKRVDTSFLKNNVYKYPQFVAWGYGMWFDRREKLEQWTDFTRLENYVKHCSLLKIFTPETYRIRTILRMIKHQYILGDSLPYFLPEEERYCVYPSISKVRNEGFDGSGLHCGNETAMANVYHNMVIDENMHFEPQLLEPLYCERLKEVYDAAYRRPFNFKRKVADSMSFLIYKLTGKFWLIP